VLFDNLSTWGWFYVIVGILQIVASVSIVNPFPFAAFMLFIVDVLVIYGLATYGGQRRERA